MMFGEAWRDRAAARWLARMNNEGAAFDRAAFERWRSKSANARAFEEMAASWVLPLRIGETRFAQGAAQTETEASVAPDAWGRRGVLGTLAAAMIVVIGIGQWRGNPGPHTAPPSIMQRATLLSTDANTVRAFRLSDGSVATLGRASRIEIAFSNDVRQLSLVKGHARFEVAHDVARPFEVRAGPSLITAHGTVFDVQIVAHTIRVMLLRGAIDVVRFDGEKPTGAVQKLRAGESVTVPPIGSIGLSDSGSGRQTGSGPVMLSFDRTQLADAITTFNRRNVRQIALHADVKRDETVSGGFAANDPEGFAQMLGSMFDLIVSRSPAGDYVLMAKP